MSEWPTTRQVPAVVAHNTAGTLKRARTLVCPTGPRAGLCSDLRADDFTGDDDLHAAVLLPALRSVVIGNRVAGAVALRGHGVGLEPLAHEVGHDCVGTLF